MIRVTIDLVPASAPTKIKRLGYIEIFNTGTSNTPRRGNYGARIFGQKYRLLERVGQVNDHPRLTSPVFTLLRKILESAGY